MKSNRFLGAILLIAGTSIGAGTLALPIITASYGFPAAFALFVACWFFMTLAALLMLEVNLSLAPGAHLVSMARARLGPIGALITWLVYLLLLYALMVAYTESMGDLVVSISKNLLGLNIKHFVSIVGLLSVFAAFIYWGAQWADWLNRLLMLGLAVTFLSFVYIFFPHVNPKHWTHVQFKGVWWGLPVLMTTFGYQVVIPSLRNYLESDANRLQWAIILGGLIPLLIYSIWELLVLGVVPLSGPASLFSIQSSIHTVPRLINVLHTIANSGWLSLITHLLLFFIIGTSLVGVSLALFDFLLDTPIRHYTHQRLMVLGLTFIPPGVFALLHPAQFITVLSYGGILVSILLILLPALMVLSQRYWPQKAQLGGYKAPSPAYRTPGGLLGVLMAVGFAVGVIVIKCLSK